MALSVIHPGEYLAEELKVLGMSAACHEQGEGDELVPSKAEGNSRQELQRLGRVQVAGKKHDQDD